MEKRDLVLACVNDRLEEGVSGGREKVRAQQVFPPNRAPPQRDIVFFFSPRRHLHLTLYFRNMCTRPLTSSHSL